MLAAAAITRNPEPINITPIANLAGAEGFKLRRASAIHIHAKNGANRTMNRELNDWNQPVGITKCSQPTVRSVYLSANKFIDEPACSKPEKNSAQPQNRTTNTTPRLRSSRVRSAKMK